MGFAEFIRERQCLQNVTPATLEWYTNSFRWLQSESPTQAELKDAVVRMRERGLKPTGCNCVIRALNSYLHWASGSDRKCGAGCTHPRMAQLKEPQIVLPTFTDADVKRRVVPFSFELRRAMFRYCQESKAAPDHLLFASRTGTALGRRVVLRDVKLHCKALGFTPPARTLHAFRHTFAVNYLRRGGSVFHLQKVLGHSSLDMTRRYANLVTADLQAMHERVSLLSK